MADEVDEMDSDTPVAAMPNGDDDTIDMDADGEDVVDSQDIGHPQHAHHTTDKSLSVRVHKNRQERVDTAEDVDNEEGDSDTDADDNSDSDHDAEGEDDPDGEADVDHDDLDDDEAEGVGAVKIKPGDTDEDDSDSNNGSDSGDGSDFSARESTAEWHDAPEHDEEDEEQDNADEEEESDVEAKYSLHDDDTDGESESNSGAEGAEGDIDADGDGSLEANGDEDRDSRARSHTRSAHNHTDTQEVPIDDPANQEDDSDLSPTSARRSSAPQIARDLLPAQRGVKTDSHSVFNQLVLDEDPMDGSRVLRKRKTSSAEAEDKVVEETMSLRKRRKNPSDELTEGDATQEQTNDGTSSTRSSRPSRSSRQKATATASQTTVVKKSQNSIVVSMRLKNTAELSKILTTTSKPPKKRSGGRSTASQPSRSMAARNNTAVASTSVGPPTTPFFSSIYSQPFYSFYDKETDELKGKPYGGILTETQADTTKTLPTAEDRKRFDEAKQEAEEKWRQRVEEMQKEEEAPLTKKSKQPSAPASQIKFIEFGGWEIKTWYAAPYPEEYSRNQVLYICEFCLKYMNSDYVAWRHKLKCPAKHPPGDEIYRHGSISFFEVDGRKNPVYCQNLCLLAKLFLGSKTLYYDVEPFLFYVLCEYDDLGYHFVGYFSKEKRASSLNNVSCILTLPIRQRKGYGNLLIDFSYLLTRVEEKVGSPEKPLSDMGLVSYRNYWRLILCKYLIKQMPEDKSQKKGLSIRQMAVDTGMTPDDVVSALEALRFLVKDKVTNTYAFRIDLSFCHKEVQRWESKGYVKLNAHALTWVPYVMGRSNATNFELGPALNAIAPREEDDEPKPVNAMAESAIATTALTGTNGLAQKALLASESAVLESTEPNDHILAELSESTQTNGVTQKNDSRHASEQDRGGSSVGGRTENNDNEGNWLKPYETIPVTRFEVFPPISKRTGPSRTASSLTRPPPLARPVPAVRTPASRPGPKPRRSTGASGVRKSAVKKTSSAKRKTGGTGRGPGRWPRGTKKSDYGNADSGPGLPPGWLQKKAQESSSSIAVQDAEEDNEMHDTVQVQVTKGKQVETISAVFAVKDNGQPEGSGPKGKGKGKAKANGVPSNDAIVPVTGDMEVDEDEDAPGEDE
ncbi:hypothetical protein F5Y18DRAFT_248731 [Xylariaceae sp. FL1019]|nr:hypothetical protein F5Y18DRAFT_248731 [Xylariaceae sp. FL1019]